MLNIHAHIRAAKAVILPKLHHIVEFLVSQGFAMGGNLLYGLLCIRLLPVGEYAKFVVVFAIQGSLIVLMDVGISGTLAPLIGDQVGNVRLIADYVATLRQISRLIFAFAIPVTIIGYPFLVRNRRWTSHTIAAMIVIVLVSTWFGRISATYGSVLIICRQRKHLYGAQLISSYGTLALLGLCIALHRLNAFTAIIINVAGIIWVAIHYFLCARRLLGITGRPSPQKRAAILSLAVPTIPGVIFYALQGQITVLLITFFGRTEAVASVGALSRLGQIFALPSQMNGVLVEPYFARMPATKLRFNYLLVVAIAALCGGAAVVLALLFPGVFLWVLGPRYAGLQIEVALVMATGAMGLVGGVMAAVNGSRRFAYYRFVVSQIVITLVVEAIFIRTMDLSTVRAVLWFNIAVNVPSLMINALVGVYGLSTGGRRIAECDSYLGA